MNYQHTVRDIYVIVLEETHQSVIIVEIPQAPKDLIDNRSHD
jgi:outer membrane protein assembly factor BamA